MGFCRDALAREAPLWERMLHHRFLSETRDGRLPKETFARWMRQDYLFVEASIPFIAALVPRAPQRHWKPLSGVIEALQKELQLFEERATAVGVPLRGATASFVTHAYVQYLLATAAFAGYAEAFTVLYAAEKAYHDSWRVVQAGLDQASPWRPFVENWAGQPFADYVAFLETELDALAVESGPVERERMQAAFAATVRYEIAFWEMAATGEVWPGEGESS